MAGAVPNVGEKSQPELTAEQLEASRSAEIERFKAARQRAQERLFIYRTLFGGKDSDIVN